MSGVFPPQGSPQGNAQGNPWRKRALLLAPLAVAGAVGVGFLGMLRGMGSGAYNPRGVPSALIGKPAPDFTLPPLEGAERPALSSVDLRGGARPVLLNFFASWCVPCVVEHPQLVKLAREGVPVLGIAYKDRPEEALGFLRRHGNPFARLGVDLPGRVAIDWGLYGVPETYLLDRAGMVRWRWAGPMTEEILRDQLNPLLRQYA